jgi:hypothetical protein
MSLMSTRRISLGLASLAVISATAAYAQTPRVICGTVTGPSGTGLPGVTVTLALAQYHPRGSGQVTFVDLVAETPPITATTNTNGDYLFPRVPVGTFNQLRLSFGLPGFQTEMMGTNGYPWMVGPRFDARLVEWSANQAAAAPVVERTVSPSRGTFTRDIVDSVPAAWRTVALHGSSPVSTRPCDASR